MTTYRLLIFCMLLSGCGTLAGRHQFVKISTDVDRAKVTSRDEAVGNAPGFFEFSRSKSRSVTLEAQGKSKTVELESNYRWRESFTPNLLSTLALGPFSLLGFGMDFLTGAAWDYEKPKKVVFFPDEKLKPLLPKSIAIAPPVFENELASDEIANELRLLLKERYPSTRIVGYDEKLGLYASYESHHAGFTPREYRDGLYRELGTTHLAFSRVTRMDSTMRVNVRVIDILRDEEIEKFEATVPRTELRSTKEDSIFNDLRSRLVGLIPNSIGVQSTSGDFFRSGYRSENDGTSLGSYRLRRSSQLGMFNSSLSLTSSNVLNLKTRSSFMFRFRFVPSITFRNDEYHIEYSSGSNSLDRNWKIYQLGAGLGPEVGLDTAVGYFYLNVIPQVTHYWILGPLDYTVFKVPVAVEIGHSSFLSERINMRIAAQLQTYPDEVFDPLIRAGDPRAQLYSGYTAAYAALSIEYVFPEARSQVKRFLE